MATRTFQVGSWALGVRSSSVEVDAALQRVLRAHQVEDLEAPANFSLVMADPHGKGHARSFNFLYRSSQAVVRTRVPSRVLRALFLYLSDFAEPASMTLRLSATGLVADGVAVIAPYQLRYQIETIQTRLNRSGLQIIDLPALHLDPVSGELLVPEPTLTLDTAALAEFEQDHSAQGRELPPVSPGRYPIAAWAIVTGEEHAGPLGRASGAAAAAQHVLNADSFGARETLRAVVRVTSGVALHGIWWRDPADLVAQLSLLAKGA